jgi:hypothetical protein
MKKLVLLLTVILLALCLTSCGETKSANGFDYTVNDDGTTCTIVGIDSSLPEWLEVLEDWGWAYGNRNYSSYLVIPKTLRKYTVTHIAEGLFSNFDITSVTIPNSITHIGSKAFYECDKLSKVYISDTDAWCNIKFYDAYSNPLYNGADLYLNGKLVTEVKPSNNVTAIKSFAFYGYQSLTNIVIPDSVTSIGWSAFCGCNALTNVVIPDGVTKIDNYAFYDCNLLTIMVIPESVTSVAGSAFSGCTSLKSISVSAINPNYKDIDGNVYTKDGKALVKYAPGKDDTTFIIPEGVTSIEKSAFSDCRALTSITIPDGVNSIGDYAFSGCWYLESIAIPDGITSIGEAVFDNCESLTSVVIPDSVTNIGEYAFYNCTALTSVVIPEGVTSIGNYAFQYCDRLCIVYNNSSLDFNIGSIANGYVAKNAKIVVNKDNISYADSKNKYILTDDGFLFSYKQGEYTLIAYDGRESEVTLPEKINGSTYAMLAIKGLNEVVIPEGITSIKSDSFDSFITSITIPASVTSINADVFSYCSTLKSIQVSEENTVYKSIDGNLYTKEGNLLILYAKGKADTQCVVPKEVVKIGEKAFANISTIKSVVIHNGVTNIANYAFYGCEDLEYVYFTGTQEEWKKVVIGENNDCLINAIIVYEYVVEE